MTGAGRGATLVVGGGPAGAAAALGLARRGLPVTLVEASEYDGFRAGETLPPIGRSLLARLGLWERFAAQGHVPSQAIQSAWGSAALAEQHSLFSPHGTGWHVDRRRFDAMLAEAAEEEGASVHRAARVTSLSGTGPFVARVEGAGGCLEMEAQHVIDATGRAAQIARSLGSQRLVHDRLVGVMGLFTPPEGAPAPAAVLLLEAMPEGWWYSVPLPDGSLLAAAMVDADAIQESGLRPLEYYQNLLERSPRTRERAGRFRPPGSVTVRKASTERLSRIAGPGFLAVGDAAASYDPLSSQGICKALMSGELAAQAIADRLAGDDDAFGAYERRAIAELTRFLADQARFYAMERRWPDAPFWRRRHARAPSGPRAAAGTHSSNSIRSR